MPAKRATLKKFWADTKRCNEINLAHASKKIQECLNLPPCCEKRLCIVATGSDGRKERGFASLVEPIIICKKASDTHLGRIIRSLDFVRLWDKTPLQTAYGVETKFFDQPDALFSCAYGQPDRIFPQRVLDAVLLFGSEEMLKGAKAKVAAEFAGPHKKAIREKLKGMKKNYRKGMLNGSQVWKGHVIVNYDLPGGLAYHFDEPESGGLVRSFKNGPLRYVQISVMFGLAQLAAGDERRAKELAIALPTPTVERLEYLDGEKGVRLSREQIRDLTDSYLFFLREYHRSEKASQGGTPKIEFSAPEAQERISAIDRILEEGIFK